MSTVAKEILQKAKRVLQKAREGLRFGETTTEFAKGNKDLQVAATIHMLAKEELKQGLEKLQKRSKETIHALVAIIEKRDAYTAGHQQRVARLACAIAEEMNLPEETCEGIFTSANLHDIGKIYVPAEILNKPSELSKMETDFIRTHPQVGYDILKTIEFDGPVPQAILQHHERLDGSGYPTGLCGEEIILEARILSVADVVEAMFSHRPYRPSRGINKALGELTLQRGVLYDTNVVDACLRLFSKQVFKLNEL